MKIPLFQRLKREMHRKIAQAQDLIIEEVYNIFEKPVLHGGTAIWRCYAGKRFSEVLDFYLPKDKERVEKLFQALEKKGLRPIKRKITENSIYSEWEFERVRVRLEATFQPVKGSIVDYENVDGNHVSIYSLTPEEFIQEKTAAYLKRRKIRDLWDIFFLIKLLSSKKKVEAAIRKLMLEYQSPIDEEDLKALILEGIVPSAKEMMEYIKTWERKST